MKTVKFTIAIMLAFMVTSSFAAKNVKSKLGDIELTNQKTEVPSSAQQASMTSSIL